jgi:nickel superoxide dismutase
VTVARRCCRQTLRKADQNEAATAPARTQDRRPCALRPALRRLRPGPGRIEAESLKAIDEKYQQNTDPAFRTRALIIKEQRSELVKHHLWVLWTDYFKAPHFEEYPQLNTLFNEATKLAGGGGGTKSSTDPAVAEQLLAKIEEISKIFWETKQA